MESGYRLAHQFGYAMGFAQEQNCPDRPSSCTEPAQAVGGTHAPRVIGLALTALVGCGGEPINGSLELSTDTAALSSTFSYGQHHPQGEAAMAHLYGPNGTWKPMTNVQYIWNYYSQYATPAHPYDRSALIAYADGTHNTTARDANGHLLLDANHDGELDTSSGGYAFHEHNGIGIGGAQTGTPFTQFWFDDNWLARYASQAYQRPLPQGLSSYSDFTRWRILGGDATAWSPYSGSAPDQLALNGLYSLAVGNASSAMSTWRRLRDNSGYRYDGPGQRYIYPNIGENYHLGLFKLLTDNLLVSTAIPASDKAELVDHSMALRSNILSNQERSSSTFLGWRSNIHDTGSLIKCPEQRGLHQRQPLDADHAARAGVQPVQQPRAARLVARWLQPGCRVHRGEIGTRFPAEARAAMTYAKPENRCGPRGAPPGRTRRTWASW